MEQKKIRNGIIFGSTGILGSRISLDLAQKNTNLILHGKSFEKLIKLNDEIKKVNKNVIFFQADITHKKFAANLLSKVGSKFSRIDFVINLIGVFFGLRPLTNFSHKEWDNLIEINLSSCWRIVKELEPLLRKSLNAKIIFLENKDISSGKAYHNTFSICQKAKKTMFKIFNKENSKFRIKVNFIEIEKVNAGMSFSLSGKQKYDEKKLKEISDSVIRKCL
tara:strand:+ start:123 stop:785 length:663 start_codon:yes stop_codon:yes gene_type:complete